MISIFQNLLITMMVVAVVNELLQRQKIEDSA
jgi:hypothetical protein